MGSSVIADGTAVDNLLRDFLFGGNGAGEGIGLDITISGAVGTYGFELWVYDANCFVSNCGNGITTTLISISTDGGNSFQFVAADEPVASLGTAPTSFEFSANGTDDVIVRIEENNEPHDQLRINGFAFSTTQINVDVDIKPGSDPNSINLCSNGAVPVAIFGSDTFVVDDIDTETLRFAGSSVKVVGKKDPHTLCSFEDVDGDFIDDLVCHFLTTDIAALDGDSLTATVNGELLDGTPIEGSDGVNIVKDTCN